MIVDLRWFNCWYHFVNLCRYNSTEVLTFYWKKWGEYKCDFHSVRWFKAVIVFLKTILSNSRKGKIQALKACYCHFHWKVLQKLILWLCNSWTSHVYDIITTVINKSSICHNHEYGITGIWFMISFCGYLQV